MASKSLILKRKVVAIVFGVTIATVATWLQAVDFKQKKVAIVQSPPWFRSIRWGS